MRIAHCKTRVQVGRHKEKAATGEMEERSKHVISMVIDCQHWRSSKANVSPKKQVEKLLE